MTERLSFATADRLAPDVAKFNYDRSALSAGVLHIGLGAFHRAHQAPLFETLIEQGDLGWGVVGASLRSPSIRDALSPQDGLYTLTIEEDDRRATRLIGTMLEMIVAPEHPQRLIEAIASPAIRLVTITVTEKGYRLDPSSGELVEDDPEIQAELASLASPTTMPGYLAAGLKLRRDRGMPPITIASCDNMTDNGGKLSKAVANIAAPHDESLCDWIGRHCAFPNSMVDRIVPATTGSDIESIASRIGLLDLAAVRTEPFCQWVIEEPLTGAARELERAGVRLTKDLAPFERAKLRLLNGAHSAMAYLGGLAGIETVDAFVAEPWGERFVHRLWDEIGATLLPASGLDVGQYQHALMRRFANRALGHRLRQIAIDGSQKLAPRLLAPALELVRRGRRPETIALAVAAWMRWQSGRDDQGMTFTVDDPLQSTTARLARQDQDPADTVRALMSLGSVFPTELSSDQGFFELVRDSLRELEQKGARATLERHVCEGTAR